MTKKVIDIRNLNFSYNTDKGTLSVLRDFNLSINKGEFVCIIGRSGCGKTTLIKLIAGILQNNDSTQILDGHISVLGLNPVLAQKSRLLTMVLQKAGLLPWRTVAENLSLPLEVLHVERTERLKKIKDVLRIIGLTSFSNFKPEELSAGMIHRIALARALIQSPPIWLFDEPFSHLDEITREILEREVLKLHAIAKCTVLWVTHSIEEAVFLADRVIALSSGKQLPTILFEYNTNEYNYKSKNHTKEYWDYVKKIKDALRSLDMDNNTITNSDTQR